MFRGSTFFLEFFNDRPTTVAPLPAALRYYFTLDGTVGRTRPWRSSRQFTGEHRPSSLTQGVRGPRPPVIGWPSGPVRLTGRGSLIAGRGIDEFRARRLAGPGPPLLRLLRLWLLQRRRRLRLLRLLRLLLLLPAVVAPEQHAEKPA